MEEGATYYRMQSRPAPSSHGVVQPAPVQRITKNSQEFQHRKQIFSQFPQEWKDDVLQEKDSVLRLRKFEQYKRQVLGEETTSQSQQQQQVMMNGGGGHPQVVSGGPRQMPSGVMTNRTVHVVTRNPQQPQSAEGNYIHNNGTPMMVRRAPVLSDPNRASPIPTGVRIVGQQPVRGPNGARLLPARTSSQYQPQASSHQFVRRVVTSAASSPSLEEPGAKRAKMTPSPPNYGQQQQHGQQVVYVQQQEGQRGQQQPQQVVYIQGRMQSPNGTMYITRQQQGSDQVMLLKEEPRGGEPASYAQQQHQQGLAQRRQHVVYVRAGDGQQQVMRRAAAGSSPQTVEGRMVSPPGVSTAQTVSTSSSAIAQALHSQGPPVLQRMVDNTQPQPQHHQQHQQSQQHYLQPSGGSAMHKSSSMPVFANTSQMPRSPQVTAMRSPAPAYANVSSPGGQMIAQQHQQQMQGRQSPMVHQHQTQQQQQMTMGTHHHHHQQQQQHQQQQMTQQRPQQQQQQAKPALKATPEYREALEKLRKRFLDDFQCLARRQLIDGVKPSSKFEGVMNVLCMKRVVPIENLETVAIVGAAIVEQSRLAWPLTKEIKEFIRSGILEKACDVKLPDPWESVRDKFVSPIELPPEVLKAIS